MKILHAVVITGHGADKVSLMVDKPNPIYPYEGYLTMSFDVSQGRGAEYVEKQFETKAEVVERIKSAPKFSGRDE